MWLIQKSWNSLLAIYENYSNISAGQRKFLTCTVKLKYSLTSAGVNYSGGLSTFGTYMLLTQPISIYDNFIASYASLKLVTRLPAVSKMCPFFDCISHYQDRRCIDLSSACCNGLHYTTYICSMQCTYKSLHLYWIATSRCHYIL